MQPSASSNTYATTVGRRVVNFSDPVPEGRQILSSAGFDPADEHVLIQLLRHGTRSIGLDEPVDLREAGAEAFEAFRSDRVFRFTLDDRGYDWGAGAIKEARLREIASVPEDEVLVLELRDEGDRDLSPDDHVSLTEQGTEHLRTAKRLITVTLDGVDKKIARGVYTTEQLIEKLGVSAGYLLNVLNAAGQLVTLKPGETLRVRQGMKFFSQVPCGGSA
jgi:multiubiquitin